MISYIIPSAGFSKRLYPLTASTPKLLVKLNGVPIFSLLYQQAVKNECGNVIVAISPEFALQFQTFIETNYKNTPIPIITKIVDNPSAGVLYSVTEALKCYECGDQALIVLSDTLYTGEFPPFDTSFVLCAKVNPPINRWCLVETDENNSVIGFHDKPDTDVNTDKALIGVYHVFTHDFILSAKRVFQVGEKLRGEFQLSQAFVYYMLSRKMLGMTIDETNWHDTGVLGTLRQASNDFFLSRCFNHIKIENGFLVKSSPKKDVLRKQYLWYQAFKHKNLIPAIYSYEESIDRASITMELCAMPDLGTYFNYCIAEPTFFEQTLSHILSEVDTALWKNENRGCDAGMGANTSILVDKLEDRLNEYFGIEDGGEIDLPLNNYHCLLNELSEIAKNPITTPIHGDFILSNILFDPQRMTFKLIDPRGEYGGLGVYGELRYDLAKLLHSVDGLYEQVIHNLYTIQDNRVGFFMSDAKRKCFDVAQETIFKFAESKGITRRELKAIEASLFLSMLPLHSENKSHQMAFRAIAIRIMEELYENCV